MPGPSLTPAARKKRVALVEGAARDLIPLERKLEHLAQEVPAALREVQRIRAALETAMAPPPPEEKPKQSALDDEAKS